MHVARALTEIRPSIRWRLGQAVTVALYRRAFRKVGAGTVILKPLCLRGVERISFGKECAVYESAWLAAEPTGSIDVGDGVYMGHSVHLHAVDDIEIGRGTSLTDGVLISNGRHDLSDFSDVAGTGRVVVGQDCFIGERAIVLGGVTIGDRAVIGAGAVVTRDVPAGATAAGVPARVISSSQSMMSDQ